MTRPLDLLDHPLLFATPRWLTPSSTWAFHAPFAMLVVDLLQPGTVVEVGTTDGDSYCALCQAVQELGLEARCHAVGAWGRGAPSGEAPPGALRAHHDTLYGAFSRLMGGGCEAALAHFPERSIDLLHVDGAHGCRDGPRHLDAWLPKLSDRGVVLVHGTHVSERDAGLAEAWERHRGLHPHWELPYGRGAGLLAVGDVPAPLAALLQSGPDDAGRLRRVLVELGRRVAETAEARGLRPRLVEQAERIERLQSRLADTERDLAEAREAWDVERKLLDRSLEFVATVDQARAEHQREAERLKAEIAGLEGQMRAILSSRSWRLTRPLRRLRTLLGRP
jgi:hypothetical protein